MSIAKLSHHQTMAAIISWYHGTCTVVQVEVQVKNLQSVRVVMVRHRPNRGPEKEGVTDRIMRHMAPIHSSVIGLSVRGQPKHHEQERDSLMVMSGCGWPHRSMTSAEVDRRTLQLGRDPLYPHTWISLATCPCPQTAKPTPSVVGLGPARPSRVRITPSEE